MIIKNGYVIINNELVKKDLLICNNGSLTKHARELLKPLIRKTFEIFEKK